MELTEDSKMTLGEWLDKWMNEYMIFTVRESTWDSYKSMIKNHIKPYLGDKPIVFVTTADIQKMYNRLKTLLRHADLPMIRFHDLRHTFATMALENGMDVKTLSATIGHVSAATTLDIYSHMTDTMQIQAAVSIDRKIGGTNARMPVVEQTPKETAKLPVNARVSPQRPIPSRYRERYANPAPDACIRLTTTSGKAASSPVCRMANARNSMSTPNPATNAKPSSPK